MYCQLCWVVKIVETQSPPESLIQYQRKTAENDLVYWAAPIVIEPLDQRSAEVDLGDILVRGSCIL